MYIYQFFYTFQNTVYIVNKSLFNARSKVTILIHNRGPASGLNCLWLAQAPLQASRSLHGHYGLSDNETAVVMMMMLDRICCRMLRPLLLLLILYCYCAAAAAAVAAAHISRRSVGRIVI